MERISFLILSFLFINSCSNKSDQKKIKVDNLFYEKAVFFRDTGELDSSFKYYNKAKEVFLLEGDSLSVGKCLANMGGIAENKKDYFGGQELSLSAISYFDSTKKDQYSSLSYNYNNLGLISYQLRDYSNALKFYDEAIKFILIPSSKLISLNNKAKVYEELKKYDKAIDIYAQILQQSHADPKEYARVLANIEFTRWLQILIIMQGQDY